MASLASRDMAAAMRATFTMLSSGRNLKARATSRETVVKQMQVLCGHVQVPLDEMNVVHIAGTKGKGSTASMCESMLRNAGYSTGLFTSPHLVNMRERFRLNGKPIAEGAFLAHFWHVWDTVTAAVEADESANMPGFFHFLTLLGLHIFAQESVDVIVLEVGLGGRLDATNVVPRPVVSGITTLDYDHVDILGPTLADIAREKAGIMRAGVPVYTVTQEPSAASALREAAKSMSAPLAQVDTQWLQARLQATPDPPSSIAGGAEYQKLNAALAVAMSEEFIRRVAPGGGLGGTVKDTVLGDGPELSLLNAPDTPIDPQLCIGLASARWPGRAHTVFAGVKTGVAGKDAPASAAGPLRLCLDGAHTAAAMLKANDWFGSQRSGAPTDAHVLMFNCNHGKDPLPLLAPLVQGAWDAVLIAPFDFDKPSKASVPTVQQVFQRHAQLLLDAKTTNQEDADAFIAQCNAALQDTFGVPERGDFSVLSPPLSPAAAAAIQQGTGSSCSGEISDPGAAALQAAQGVAPQYDLQWQRVLAQVWAVLVRHPHIAEAVLKPVAQRQEAAQEAAAAVMPASTRSADAVVCNSITDALSCLGAIHTAGQGADTLATSGGGACLWDVKRGRAAEGADKSPPLELLSSAPPPGEAVHTNAFISGSLYLVGNCLQHLGWSPDDQEV